MEEEDFLSPTTDQEDNNKNKKKNNSSSSSNNNSGSSGKKGANIGGGGGCGAGSMKCCQADKCTADLTEAKPYHRRHKVCEHHAKAQVVAVGGIRQRFCQQCSRFHEVSEFDETKRSCRRRLAGHNERRRKNSTDSSSHTDGSSSSSRKGTAAAAAATATAGTSTTTSASHQMKEIVCGQVDDRDRIQILSVQENHNYKHFQIR